MVAILTGVSWKLRVLICISFMARDGEHFFMFFWPFGLLFEKIVSFSCLFLYWFIDFWGV
jgi:hypothetical protein